ncbi:MAG: cell division protein FtsA [Thermoflexales bacterium]|nr:cell division protein FtsA [Thermoflexales bacterium]
MAESAKIVSAVDIGSSKVVALVGEAGEREGDFSIIGVGIVPSRGMKRGQIVNVGEVTQAIREAVDGAERSSATTMSTALVSVAGNHIQSQNSHGAVAIGRGEQGVTSEDINRVLEAAQAITVPNNREVIHVIPRHFKVDEQEGVRHPLGMLGYRLEAQTNIVTASSTAIQNLYKCLHGARIEHAEAVLAPLASAEATLTPTEREMGVVLADIGHGTTDIAIYIDGAVWHVSVLEVGGWHFTSDLAKVLRLPLDTAEQIKLAHGQASLRDLTTEAPFVAAGFGDEGDVTIQRRDMAEILHERARELFDLIMLEVKRSGYDGLLPAGLVLTGGGAQLPGLREVAREVARLPVRLAAPSNLHGLVDAIKSPAYSTAVGLVKWGMLNVVAKPSRRRRVLPNLRIDVKGWFGNLLPRSDS